MESLLSNFGLDWKLFLSQAANFLIVLIVLRLTVYRPLLGFLSERRRKIESGLAAAETSERRLKETTAIQQAKIREAEQRGVAIITRARKLARREELAILAAAAHKEKEALERAAKRIQAHEEDSKEHIRREAAEIVRDLLVKTVAIAPDVVDNAMIAKVVKHQIQERAS
jgi:F-type H+-transporting ATPase subunit b